VGKGVKKCDFCEKKEGLKLLSKNEYTREERYRAMAKVNEALIKCLKRTCLNNDFEKEGITEKEALKMLVRLKEIRKFWEKNKNPSDKEHDEFFKKELADLKKRKKSERDD
jgi:hypothetical protein